MDVNSREQRLRKEAELQSLSGHLVNLREREDSYIHASAAVPELLLNQINEVRHDIKKVENELLTLQESAVESPGHQLYWEAFEAEIAGELSKALKLYKDASRYTYPDTSAAARSVRYMMKASRGKPPARASAWSSESPSTGKYRLLLAVILLLILILLVAFVLVSRLPVAPEQAGATGPTLVPTKTPTPVSVILVAPETATPTVTDTPTVISAPQVASSPTPRPTPTVTATPTIAITLRPPPRIIEPKDGLTWGDGTIVFEFERLDLAYDEVYCINTLRGFDKTNTENWSYPPVGSKESRIAIEANVFRVAKTLGMKCVLWTAAIGKGSCDTLTSQPTEQHVIGLPQTQPCRPR